MFTDENIQRYVKALYPVSLLLILVPLADLTLRVFPPQFGSLQWRFTTVGILLGNFGTILLGFGLLGFVAAVAGHRTVLRAIGYLGIAMTVVTVAVLALFLLDAIQMRQVVNANAKRVVLTAGVGAMFTAILGMISFLSIARGALAATRRGTTAAQVRRPKAASPLVAAGQSSDA